MRFRIVSPRSGSPSGSSFLGLFVMSNPWDRPPAPTRFNGDTDAEVLFACVGRVISYWEAAEFELSRLYTCFGGSLDDQTLMHEYGEGRIFRERAQALDKKADEYCKRQSCQQREGDFDNLLRQCLGYADRRNDIAHGIVFRVDRITFFRDRIRPDRLHREHFAVIPPLYAHRWHKGGFPDFAYTSRELSRLLNLLVGLRDAIENYRKRL
jgi:hypothetical protein